MMRRLFLAAAMLFAAPATAQSSWIKPISSPAQPDAIPLASGGVEGATAPESWFNLGGQRVVRNVQRATLTPVLPDPAKATGAAVVVAPGGAFLMLSMDSEGWSVAHFLADHGIAAFVLKYRLTPTPPDLADFQHELIATLTHLNQGDNDKNGAIPSNAIKDALAALALVRSHAAQWHVDPARVGMVGFSAGAATTLGVVAASDTRTMPAFIAPIYGPLQAISVPASAPPMFNALAADDPLFAGHGFGLIEAWQRAHKPVEFHLYQKGGHGFGMGIKGTTSTEWSGAFVEWLSMNGFLKGKS